MDDDLRLRLIEALKNRRWSNLDAERIAAFVAGLHKNGEGEWQVWRSGSAARADHYRVARSEAAVPVYDSPVMGRTLDVANALNEIERHGADATGTP